MKSGTILGFAVKTTPELAPSCWFVSGELIPKKELELLLGLKLGRSIGQIRKKKRLGLTLRLTIGPSLTLTLATQFE